ncbi:MAG: methylated-DNA--[protein]-cysteine S-methyltransferase [Verrucomicrobiota bacterium]
MKLEHPSLKVRHASTQEIKSQGQDLKITIGFTQSPIGETFIAQCQLGICKLAFTSSSKERKEALKELKKLWPNAEFLENPQGITSLAQTIFYNRNKTKKATLNVFIKGSVFQNKVWKSLLKIPYGQLKSYGEIAQSIDAPHSSRAVGNAVGANPIAYLIPCHRVILSSGKIGHYRWGSLCKQRLIDWENSKLSNA